MLSSAASSSGLMNNYVRITTNLNHFIFHLQIQRQNAEANNRIRSWQLCEAADISKVTNENSINGKMHVLSILDVQFVWILTFLFFGSFVFFEFILFHNLNTKKIVSFSFGLYSYVFSLFLLCNWFIRIRFYWFSFSTQSVHAKETKRNLTKFVGWALSIEH